MVGGLRMVQSGRKFREGGTALPPGGSTHRPLLHCPLALTFSACEKELLLRSRPPSLSRGPRPQASGSWQAWRTPGRAASPLGEVQAARRGWTGAQHLHRYSPRKHTLLCF